jgi:hypothetical protein
MILLLKTLYTRDYSHGPPCLDCCLRGDLTSFWHRHSWTMSLQISGGTCMYYHAHIRLVIFIKLWSHGTWFYPSRTILFPSRMVPLGPTSLLLDLTSERFHNLLISLQQKPSFELAPLGYTLQFYSNIRIHFLVCLTLFFMNVNALYVKIINICYHKGVYFWKLLIYRTSEIWYSILPYLLFTLLWNIC